MATPESKSEVARLRQQFEAEYQAATLGLHGLAFGSARHDFINHKMENMGKIQRELTQLVGEQEAAKVLVETLDKA